MTGEMMARAFMLNNQSSKLGGGWGGEEERKEDTYILCMHCLARYSFHGLVVYCLLTVVQSLPTYRISKHIKNMLVQG